MKTFKTPSKACEYAMSYLYCSNAEVVVFKIEGEGKIVEYFIGSQEKAEYLMSLNRGVYAIVNKEKVQIHKEHNPFERGLCLN